MKTLMDRAKCIPSTTAQRQNEKRSVVSDLKANGYPESFIKSVRELNRTNTQPRPQENPKAYASIPYVKGVSECVRRILSCENIRTAFKPVQTLGNVFKKPKDRPTKEQLKGIVYKVTCRTCMSGKAEEIGNLGGPNTRPEPMEMSIPQFNSMRKPATIYILFTPTFLKQV